MTERPFHADIKGGFLDGSAEIDLVRSGLEDVKRRAYHRISEVKCTNTMTSFRTAAYTIAIRKIADAYQAIGI